MKLFERAQARPLILGVAMTVLCASAAVADIAPPPAAEPTPAAEATPAPSEAAVDPAKAKAAALAIKPTDIGLGDPNAPVKWIEYASTGCSHCADLALKVLPALKADYIDSGKVYYVLRDFPLDNVAAAATVIARCLPGDQFYPFMDKLFASQAVWHGPETTDPKAALLKLAAESGLDEAAVEACLKRQDILDVIVANLTEADSVLKVTSTPTSFIGDEVVLGAAPVEDFRATLDKALGVGGMTPAPAPTPEQSTPAAPGAP